MSEFRIYRGVDYCVNAALTLEFNSEKNLAILLAVKLVEFVILRDFPLDGYSAIYGAFPSI